MAIWTGLTNRFRYLRGRTSIDVDDEVTLVSEESRAAWQFRWLEDLAADVRYALRTFRRSPGFTLTAVLSLALGIGATSAIVTALDATLWRPLPIADPESLVTLSIQRTGANGASALQSPLVRQLQDAHVFADVATRISDGLSFQYDDRAERIIGEAVSPNYFTVLGVRPILGDAFSAAVRRGEWAPEAVLSYNFWSRRFGGDPSVIGRTIHLNTVAFTIVGVSAPGFAGLIRGTDFELRIPVMPAGGTLEEMALVRNDGKACPTCAFASWNVFARLAPGTTLAQAEAAADAQLQEYMRKNPVQGNRDTGPRRLKLAPGALGWNERVQGFRQTLYVLLVLAATVLLIACVNVASLLLARATARARELAVRLSIGAGRLRLVRQMLAESLLLSLLGGLAGMAIASWSAGLLSLFVPQGHITLVIDLRPDNRVWLFTLAVSVLTAVCFGLIPALHATRTEIVSALKTDSAGSAGARHSARMRQVLVVSQVAFSVVLLIATGIFVRTLADLRPEGYEANPSRVLLFTIKPQQELYTQERKRTLGADLLRRLSEVPGIQSAAIAENGAMGSRWSSHDFEIPGAKPLEVQADWVTPGYFETVGIPRLAGRDFTTNDKQGAPPVAIVNQSFAHAVLGGDDVLGKSARYWDGGNLRTIEVVGVVADLQYYDVHRPPRPTVWFAFQGEDDMYMPTLHVRAANADLASVTAAIRREFDRVDKGFPIFNAKTLGVRIDESLARERMIANIATAFGVVALTLAAVGLYGILAYSVVRRRREIGIRIALGSSSRAIVTGVAAEALRLVALGGVIGIVMAIYATRLVTRYLVNVSPMSASVLAACAATMLIVTLCAACVPALRACRVDPLTALRPE
jgi:predicted permease